jgi:peptidoglycan/LPS O-acetylase OafA/YrhL
VAQLGYRPALDGVRALAIAPVVGLHAFGWPREGSLGVEIFFVLSGFLITTLLLEERIATGAISFRRFYRRRAARLVPGLVLMLAVYAIVARGAHAWSLLLGLTYTTNIANLVDTNAIPWSLGHLWSLAQEEQFYLLWPPLLLVLTRGRPTLLPKALGILVLAVALEKLTLVALGAGLERIYFAPDTHAEPILMGCLFGALFRSWRPESVTRIGGPVALLVVVGSVFAAQWVSLLTPLSPIRTLFFVACGFLILAAAAGGRFIALALGSPPLVFLGQISYSLYLWHVPILAAAGATGHGRTVAPTASAVCVAIAVCVAAASFFFVEQPLRRRWRQPRRAGDLAPLPLKAAAGA